MTIAAFCPYCGVARAVDAKFCASCGRAFDEPTAAAPVDGHQAMAQSALYWQRYLWKVNAGRLLGLVAGALVWWFVAGPLLGGNPITTFAALVVLPLVGWWIGGQLVIESIAKR